MPSRLFAAFYQATENWEPRAVREARARLLQDLRGHVLEVGAGLSFRSYPPDARIIATDYSPHMITRARRRADTARAQITVQYADVQNLPFDDDRFDHAVAILVFCSVADPGQGLAEIRRVTKPGGAVRFIEHVRADGVWAARLQSTLTPLWQRVSDGCHLNRSTVDAIRAAGFAVQSVEDLGSAAGFLPIPVRAVIAHVP